jgi:hypothetical protein
MAVHSMDRHVMELIGTFYKIIMGAAEKIIVLLMFVIDVFDFAFII